MGIVGKYVNMPDAYMSVVEALRHAGFHHGAEVELDWIDAELVPELLGTDRLRGLDAIVIPGGFGERGIEGMVAAAGYTRDHGIPAWGCASGLHVMVISVARDRAGLERANSREFDSLSPDMVIDLMPDQAEVTDKGGTMRLGSYQAALLPDSKVAKAYGTLGVTERHRHRFEFNNRYKSRLEAVGLVCSGNSPDGRLVEFVELEEHPYWVGDPGAPGIQEPARPGPPPVPRARGGGTGASRGARAAPARPRRRHLGPCPASAASRRRSSSGRWLFRVDRFHLLDPDGEPFERFVVRHPGAVTVVAGARGRHGDAGAPVPGRRGRPGARDPGGDPRRRGRGASRRRHGGSWPRRPDWRRDAGAADRHVEHAGHQRPAHPRSSWPPGCRRVRAGPSGVEEGYMTIETIRLDEIDGLVADGTLKDETTVLGLFMARHAWTTPVACRDRGAAAGR